MKDSSVTTTAPRPRRVIWAPSCEQISSSQMSDFMSWLALHRGIQNTTYRELLDWSVNNLSEFWDSIREYFDVAGEGFTTPALVDDRMPGAVWYPDARLNYAENILRNAVGATGSGVAIVDITEDGVSTEITWGELNARVAALAAGLRARGVGVGDRVVAVLPNNPEALIGLLASASIGATWCICAPDLAPTATLDRLKQLEPVVLIGSLGYQFNGKWFDRRGHLLEIEAGLPTLRHTIVVGGAATGTRLSFDEALVDGAEAQYARVPFDHSLWVLFTSGTTGAPKGIVHGHGGMVLEALKIFGLHFGMDASDRYYVAANTSWMVWNTILGNLMTGASVVTYAGSPVYLRPDHQFDIVATNAVTMFGTGAAYLRLLQATGVSPDREWSLGALRTVMSTGSALPIATYEWVHDDVSSAIQLSDVSGGTDICSAFLGSNPLEPVIAGRLQGPMLGVAIEVRDESGMPVIGEVGEMVVTRPMPSMPTCFWGDADGSLYRSAYFDVFPGAWTHGDWIMEAADGTFEVLGRSDATLNRGGVRLGSAEIYGALQSVAGVTDALVLGIELPDGGYHLPLYIVLAEGIQLDDILRAEIVAAIRQHASPRHVPDVIKAAPAIPVTHAGKKVEIPVKRLFTGPDPTKVDRGALANPQSLDWFIEEAQRFRAAHETKTASQRKDNDVA